MPRRAQGALAFAREVYHKAVHDDVFFLAGGVSFNVLATVVPLLTFAVGCAGLILSARLGDPTSFVLSFVISNVPVIGGDLDVVDRLDGVIRDVLSQSGGLTFVSAMFLVWFSTRLVGSLRSALSAVFSLEESRGIVAGKLFDVRVVLVGGLLFVLNMGITFAIDAAQDFGVDLLGLGGETLGLLRAGTAHFLAFASIWILFLGVYRFLPAGRVPWRTATLAASLAAVTYEGLKLAFGWYATEVANYRSVYGNFLTLALLFFWIYYASLGFIMSGQLAQIWMRRHAARMSEIAPNEGDAVA